MILIADSGSTKTDWVLLNDDKKIINTSKTEGLNPTVFTDNQLYKTITANKEVIKNVHQITKIYIYAAGCGTESGKALLEKVCEEIFENASVVIREDIYAAAFAVSDNKPSIVCILGTGSNSCYYDGKSAIETKIPSLGYIIMDDASGNYFGKKLLKDYFYNKMPKKLYDKFSAEYNLYPDDVKRKIYKEEHPNTYLASFAEFLIKHKNEAYCNEIINNGISEFIDNHITQYNKVYDLPIHFVGSIAYFLQDEIKVTLKAFRLNTGNFIKSPIDKLIDYHVKLTE